MRFLWQYLKYRSKLYLLLVSFVGIFTLCFALYHLPIKALLYPTVLCLCIGIIFTAVDFWRIKQMHHKLTRIGSFDDIPEKQLSQTDFVLAADYNAILQKLSAEYQSARHQASKQQADMTDYYTVWAHQIKTPIASMHLHLQNEDSALSRQLSAELHRIEQYVEMVLTYLRLQSDSTDYLIREYPLDPIIKQAVRKFSCEFIGRRILLRYQPTDCTVLTDEKWLSFVIEQLLSNALKYTPNGSITVTVMADQLTIRDTGIGIAPEDLPRVFENGFTGYNGRSDKRASGIGLYLCKRICNHLGHEIQISSILEEGTTVTLKLSHPKQRFE